MTATWGTFEVVKRNKRLWIDRVEDARPFYTPPDFVKLHSREPLIELARHFTETQSYDIGAVAALETKFRPKKR